MNETELRETGCVYHHRGVICRDKTKCESCGWSPAVEKKRKEKVQEQYGEVLRRGVGRV